jgi:hypothetical protein
LGLTKNMLQLILSSKAKRNLMMESTLMIGRQHLHLSQSQLSECLSIFGHNPSEAEDIIVKNEGFADGFFEFIGAKTVDSLDASDYEDASIIQDLNEPLPKLYANKFSLVLDSGTLEHVFNFPGAIKSCMELTAVGGHYIGIYPCNNFFGHGFYQFSSELFYRVLSKENGFEIEDLILFVDELNTTYYSVPDTNEEHQRINFTNQKPVLLYVVAKKLETVEVFRKNPLQMDYVQLKWQGKRKERKVLKKRKTMTNVVPTYVRNLVKAILNKRPLDDRFNFKKPYFREYKLK